MTIYSEQEAVAVMDGDLSIRNTTWFETSDPDAACLYTENGKITLNGADIRLHSAGDTIYSKGGVECIWNVKAESSQASAIRCEGSEVSFKQIHVTLSGKPYAITSEDVVSVASGTLTCTGGIYSKEAVVLAGDKAVITADEEYAIYCFRLHLVGDLEVACKAMKNPAIQVYGPDASLGSSIKIISDTTALKVKGDVSLYGDVEIRSGGGYAIQTYIKGNVRMSDGGTYVLSGEGRCIQAIGDITMDGGTLTAAGTLYSETGDIRLDGDAEVTTSWESAISAYDGAFTTYGHSKYTSTSDSYGVYARERIFFAEGSETEVTANAAAVLTHGDMDINGKLTATSTHAAALSIEGNGTVRRTGSLYAYGDFAGVYCQGSFEYDPFLYLAEPADGRFIYDYFYDAEWNRVKRVVIDHSKYKVKLVADNGTQETRMYTVDPDTEYTLPECMFTAPPGKRFRQWNWGKPGETIVVDKSIEIHAEWTDDTYKVYFSAGVGSGVREPDIVLGGTKYTVPGSAFTPPMYMEFYRWRTNDGEYLSPGMEITVTKDIVLTANWKEKDSDYWTVLLNPGSGGTGTMDPILVAIADPITVPEPSFTPDNNLRFVYWMASTGVNYNPGDTFIPTGNMTLTARWEPIPRYKITFYTDGRFPAPPEQLVVEGECVTKPPVPVTDGYVFDTWYDLEKEEEYDFSKPVYKSFGLKALWDYQVPDVRLINLQIPRIGTDIRNHVDYLTPAEYGVDSCIWYEVKGGGLRDIEMPAKFEKGKTYMAQITLIARDDYAFDRFKGQEQFKEFLINGEETNVYGFEVIDRKTLVITTYGYDPLDAYPVNICILLEEGQDFAEVITVPYNEPYALPECKYEAPEGMVFAGWNLGQPGDIINPVTQMIMTPTWMPADAEKITVTFETDGGTEIPPQTRAKGEKAMQPVDPVKEGCIFTGWYRDIGCTIPFDFDTALMADTTLYAGWRSAAGGPDGWRSIDGREYW